MEKRKELHKTFHHIQSFIYLKPIKGRQQAKYGNYKGMPSCCSHLWFTKSCTSNADDKSIFRDHKITSKAQLKLIIKKELFWMGITKPTKGIISGTQTHTNPWETHTGSK